MIPALFKLLPLCWDSEQGSLCENPINSRVSVSCSLSKVILDISFMGFQSLGSEGSSSWRRSSGLGVWCLVWSSGSWLPRGTATVFISLPLVDGPTGGVGPEEEASVPPTHLNVTFSLCPKLWTLFSQSSGHSQ